MSREVINVTQACCLNRDVDILSAHRRKLKNLRDVSGKMPELQRQI